MRGGSVFFKATFAASLLSGIVLGLILSSSFYDHGVQYFSLGFIIGFFLVWLFYLAFWFVVKGFQKTAFPRQSKTALDSITKLFGLKLTQDQERMLIELTGTVLMICIGLCLSAGGFLLVSGFLYVLGTLAW